MAGGEDRCRPWLVLAAAALALVSAVATGCGSGKRQTASGEGSTARTATRLATGRCASSTSSTTAIPSRVEKYWNEYLVFVKTSVQQAPPVVRGAHAVVSSAVRTQITPVLKKYHFDFKRIESEGSPAEQAVLGEPPDEVAAAKTAWTPTETRFVATEVLLRGRCRLQGEQYTTKAYCAAGAAQEQGLEKVAASGFDPMRFVRTSPRTLLRALDEQDAKAPPRSPPTSRRTTPGCENTS